MTPTPPRPPGPPPSGPPPSGASPSGPPPSAGPPPGPPRGPGGGGFAFSRNQLVAIGAAIVLGVGVLIGVLVASGGDDGGGGEEEDIQLVSAAEPGADPFTPPAAPETAPPSTIAPPQGPYGGTGDDTLCDREGVVAYLTDPANTAQARAWAGVIGIQVSEIPAYVRDLIPTTVTSDVRITNHTFEGGRAVAFQAVLQSGTAVLVDTYGKPAVRCRCGNPLLPPRVVKSPTYVGTRWPGFDPDRIIVIQVSTTQIYPPGGTTTTTTTTTLPQPEPEPEPMGPSPEEEARARVDEAGRACYPFPAPIEDQESGSVDTRSSGNPNTFIIEVISNTVTGNTQVFTWEVDRASLRFTPLNDLAQVASDHCSLLR